MHFKPMHSAKLCLPVLMIILSVASCKDKPNKEEPAAVPEAEVIKSLDPAFAEIARFMDFKVSDSTLTDTLFNYKAVMGEEGVIASDAEQNLKFYKGIMKNGKASALPIFEDKGSDRSLLLFTGKGYLGPIWARILIDKGTGTILKVRFGHEMESEGYGNGIMSSAFGDQFSNQEILSEGNVFGLNQNGKAVIQGAYMVDGVSGATITSSAVVQMLNDGLKKYESYLTH
ncbi:FMN-binding protein [Lentiprolixibacter aurantiacus]|uniref:FMN-binding protein n=1 Tax=Lentiprolixibacter aurantiacus TaxID=2993939 RepID=A0AAE3MNZ2_9FLAO|nr:FMN-binding protein [Lentiprolixibacter aurantiacus]MCX2720756.1 FMN-binding protein [Lentiprolixibacter aurantiacus]